VYFGALILKINLQLIEMKTKTVFFGALIAALALSSCTQESNSVNDWLNPNLSYGSVSDQDGNTYATIVIGNQEWMAENLRTTKFCNGVPIPNVTDRNHWGSLNTSAWVYYDNDNQYDIPYGKLYNWYAANDLRNICPCGWHVPSDAEWTVLINYLDNNSLNGKSAIVGGWMKSMGTQYWQSPNAGATNQSGFSGLPGGWRIGTGTNKGFTDIGLLTIWWSTTEYSSNSAWTRQIGHNFEGLYREKPSKKNGFSVRCVKD
jgi:uncharacterized protein (TIGR02145 family)